jgi:hypothetical protein
MITTKTKAMIMTKIMLVTLLMIACPYAAAMEISVTGTTVHMSGPVVG